METTVSFLLSQKLHICPSGPWDYACRPERGWLREGELCKFATESKCLVHGTCPYENEEDINDS